MSSPSIDNEAGDSLAASITLAVSLRTRKESPASLHQVAPRIRFRGNCLARYCLTAGLVISLLRMPIAFYVLTIVETNGQALRTG
jgi:hypothetical protein